MPLSNVKPDQYSALLEQKSSSVAELLAPWWQGRNRGAESGVARIVLHRERVVQFPIESGDAAPMDGTSLAKDSSALAVVPMKARRIAMAK